MQCVTDLAKLRDSIAARVLSLRQIVGPISTPIGADDRRALAFVTIEIDNLVVVGLRQYTKSSLLRGRTATGARISASVRPASAEEAAAYMFKSINPAGYAKRGSPVKIAERDEVAIRDPKQIEKVFLDYDVSNQAHLGVALSLNANVFSEAKVFRHFFAHRAKNTYEAVQAVGTNLGLVGRSMPEHLIIRGRPGTGVRFVDGWLADIENFFDLAV